MALESYTLCLVELSSPSVPGGLLTEESDITIDRDSRGQEVNTVAKQFAGVSPGAGIMMVDITNAVPSADFEVNPGKFFVKLYEVVQFKFHAAGRTMTTKGFVMRDNFRHGVNKEATLQFHALCEMADWE